MPKQYTVDDLKPGVLLISEPFLGDSSFHRSVVLVCEHSNSHSFGLILNQKQEIVFDSMVDEQILENVPLFSGGPVDPSIMQFLHKRPDLIPDGIEIAPGIFGREVSKKPSNASWGVIFRFKKSNSLSVIPAGGRANSPAKSNPTPGLSIPPPNIMSSTKLPKNYGEKCSMTKAAIFEYYLPIRKTRI